MARSDTYTQTTHPRGKTAVKCKPKGCPTCGAQECIERPRFFCGQLLTDKDLDAAQRYVIEKNRLHNRYLVGTGVVCGLAVRCAPCEDGGVVVEPGYAIDCCGNDIVLCEAAPFNVKDYIEACFKPPASDCNDKIRIRMSKCEEGPKEYCLFVSYNEEAARPITALVRDNGCQTSRCEPSRIKETFRFDLIEKSTLPKDPPNLWTKLAECLPNAGKKMGAKAAEFYALEAISNNPEALNYAHRDLMRDLQRSVLDLYRNGPNVRCNLDDLLCAEEPEVPRCPTLRVDCPTSVTGGPVTYTAVITPTPEPTTVLDYNWSVSAGLITSGQGTKAITVDTGNLNGQTVTAGVEVGGLPPECPRTASCSTSIGASTAPPTTGATFNAITAPPPPRDIEAANLGQVLSPYFQYMIDCFCDSLLVPCAPCVGPEGVLIACVTVEDGKVIKICNIARTQLITGPALRYWLGPLFNNSHDLLELLCCQLEVNKKSRWTEVLSGYFRSASRSSRSAFGRFGTGKAVSAASIRDLYSRGSKVVFATARMAANVAKSKIADFSNLGQVANPDAKLGGEFSGLTENEVKATLASMDITVVDEKTAKTSEEKDTITNLKSMYGVVNRGSKVEIVKDPDGRVITVREKNDS